MRGSAATVKTPLLRAGGYSLRRPRLAAFLCSLAVAAAFILPFVLRRGGILYVSNDQVTQQIPFTQAIVRNLHEGHWLYDFELDLGSGLVEGYAWYNLGSVFSLVQYLFPAEATPYLLGPMLILKFGVAGLFAYMWLRRATRTDLAALCGSMLYAFSGLAVSNMVFPFADVYALFPLLPLGMDLAFEEGRWGGFTLAVALNALVNPPLFVGAGVFMLLYFGVKLARRAYAWKPRRFAQLAAETACGLALAAVILAPFAASLAGNPRVGGTLGFGWDWFFYIPYRYFEIMRSLVLPAEVIHANSMLLLFDAVSPEWYLPMLGTVPLLAFVLRRRRHWAAGLVLASFACMLLPVLNAAFSALNATYYTRWLYMPLLAAALCSALWAALAAMYAGCVLLWRFYYGYPSFITYLPAFAVNLALCAAGLAATAFARRGWRRAPRLVCCGVALFAVATGGFNLLFNQAEASVAFGELTRLPANSIYAAATVPLPEGVYRINSPVSNLYFGHGSPFSFNSTVPRGVFDLQAAFGRQRTSISRIEYSEPGLWSLLGVEYLLLPPGSPADVLPNLEFYAEGQPYDVYRNPDALPLVMGFDAALPEAAVEGLDNTHKSIALLHGLVLNPEAEAALGLPRLGTDAAALGYAEGVAARQAMAATGVTPGRAALSARVDMPAAGAALVTLPYDAGWRCTVNGEAATPVLADWGLMALPLDAGDNLIEMRYWPAGQSAGLGLCALGLIGLGLMLWLPRRAKRRRADEALAEMELAAPRCTLRPFREEDLDDFMAYRNNLEWMQYQNFKGLGRAAYQKALLGKATLAEGRQYAMVHSAEGRLIGDVYLRRSGGVYWVGYTVRPEYARRGYTGEVLAALLARLKEAGAKRVMAGVMPENLASAALLKKCGFTRSGSAQDGEDLYSKML